MLSEQFQWLLGRERGRCRILASEKTAIRDPMRLPVADLLEDGPQPYQLVFDEERHDVSQLHGFFLTIGESRHALSLHQGFALVGHMTQHTRRVADQR